MSFVIDTSHKSPNFNSRGGRRIEGIVIHTTEGKWPSDLDWLCSTVSQVSAHYVTSPDARVFQLVDDAQRAWHAGVGSYLGFSDWNTISIGIEVSHQAGHAYAPGQLEVLRELCLMLIAKYGIKQNMIAAHRWIAPQRRRDPTDWTDSELSAWIGMLYATDYSKLWGNDYAYFADSGIAAAWRSYARVLGAAVSDETKDSRGHVWRLFEHGAVDWTPDGVLVYLQGGKVAT